MTTETRAPIGEKVPAPPGHFLLGQLPELNRDALGYLTQCARTYGGFVRLRLGATRIFLISDPDLIEQVLVTDYKNFTKGRALRYNRRLFGNGLLVSEGDFWRRQRRLAQPAFHRERIAAYGEIMVAFTERMLADWRDGQTRDLHADMMRLTMEITVKTLFDAAIAGEEADMVADALHGAQEAAMRRMRSPVFIPEWLPTAPNRLMQRSVARLDGLIYRLIRERRANPTDRGDLLSLLLAAQDEEDGSRMTDQQLRDETLTLFLAGHETTALVMTWTWYLLAQHPDVEARLADELTRVLGDRAPTLADRANLEYTEWVVLETMRLYPPAWIVGRLSAKSCQIGPHEIPAGSGVLMPPWITHRDPQYFDDPEAFRPERWADGLQKRLPRFAYFPFGGGPRVCIGNAFAMLESVLLLATMARRFRCALVPNQKIVLQPAITLRPKHGLAMTLHEKTPVSLSA